MISILQTPPRLLNIIDINDFTSCLNQKKLGRMLWRSSPFNSPFILKMQSIKLNQAQLYNTRCVNVKKLTFVTYLLHVQNGL